MYSLSILTHGLHPQKEVMSLLRMNTKLEALRFRDRKATSMSSSSINQITAHARAPPSLLYIAWSGKEEHFLLDYRTGVVQADRPGRYQEAWTGQSVLDHLV